MFLLSKFTFNYYINLLTIKILKIKFSAYFPFKSTCEIGMNN